jgi:hypothetical protein
MCIQRAYFRICGAGGAQHTDLSKYRNRVFTITADSHVWVLHGLEGHKERNKENGVRKVTQEKEENQTVRGMEEAH